MEEEKKEKDSNPEFAAAIAKKSKNLLSGISYFFLPAHKKVPNSFETN